MPNNQHDSRLIGEIHQHTKHTTEAIHEIKGWMNKHDGQGNGMTTHGRINEKLATHSRHLNWIKGFVAAIVTLWTMFKTKVLDWFS